MIILFVIYWVIGFFVLFATAIICPMEELHQSDPIRIVLFWPYYIYKIILWVR